MQALLNKLHFGHMLLASGMVAGSAIFAYFMGHLTGLNLYNVIFTIIGVIILSIALARFE